MNIQNLDLSGITGSITYNSADAARAEFLKMLPGLFIAVIALLFLFGFLGMVMKITYPHHRRYRELMTSMYVAGKIRQIADKESINLLEEMKVYRSVWKKANINYRELDRVIEGELAEKITDEFEKAREGKKEEKVK